VRELVFEILLRLSKALAAAIVGLLIWIVAVGLLETECNVTLALLCWLSGAAFILLVEESPI
jgi:hypothetical protein